MTTILKPGIPVALCSDHAGYSTKPVATDYDGDGMADMSLYVYSGNTLYVYIRYARDGFSTQYVLQY